MRAPRVLLGALFAAFVAVSPVLGGPAREAEVAFSSARAGEAAIWTVSLGGGGLARLTAPGAPARPCRCLAGDYDTQPAWSPDGRLLAFVRGGTLRVVRRDGSSERRVRSPPRAEAARPAWSTRGRLAFVRTIRTGRTRHELVTADADGGNERVVVRGAFGFRSIAWSPDGRSIAFVRPYRDPAVLVVVGLFIAADRATTAPRFVLRAAGMGEVAWSPDGREVVLAASEPGAEPFDPYRLFTIRLADRAIAQLTRPTGLRTADLGPRWSPDGRLIVFTRVSLRGSAVLSVRPDGSGERVLAADAAGPAWAPGGDRIAFVDGVSGLRRPLSVSVMHPDGGRRRQLVLLRHPHDAEGLGEQSVR